MVILDIEKQKMNCILISNEDELYPSIQRRNILFYICCNLSFADLLQLVETTVSKPVGDKF